MKPIILIVSAILCAGISYAQKSVLMMTIHYSFIQVCTGWTIQMTPQNALRTEELLLPKRFTAETSVLLEPTPMQRKPFSRSIADKRMERLATSPCSYSDVETSIRRTSPMETIAMLTSTILAIHPYQERSEPKLSYKPNWPSVQVLIA